MEKTIDTTQIDKKISELEKKNQYYKLKRYEKKELKTLRKKKAEIIYKIKEDKEKQKEKEEKILKQKEEERKRKEKERLEKMKKKMLENQKNLRKNRNTTHIETQTEEQKNKKINEVLEDMCIYGNIVKQEIQEEKKKNPEKFIETKEALKSVNSDPELFALGLLSQNLESMGIETAIEKNSNNDQDDESATSTQFLSNGMMSRKKYDLHFDMGEKRNDELLNNEEEYEKFKQNLKLKLSKDYNIPVDKIIVTFPQKGSVHVQVIFQSDEFNNLDTNDFKEKFKNDSEFKELQNLKEVHTDVIVGGCKLTKAQLDSRGNRSDGWGIGENRGGKPYDPPIGWTGIGLKVWDKYENNTWIGMDNSPGEWCVAYHGVANDQSSDNVKNVTGLIVKTSFKAGGGQAHKDCPDQYHPGKNVGRGVYCTPTIKTAADQYAGISNINGVNYKTVLMVRVKPEAIRHCDVCSDSRAPHNYWVVNGTTDEIRPYRILYQKC